MVKNFFCHFFTFLAKKTCSKILRKRQISFFRTCCFFDSRVISSKNLKNLGQKSLISQQSRKIGAGFVFANFFLVKTLKSEKNSSLQQQDLGKTKRGRLGGSDCTTRTKTERERKREEERGREGEGGRGRERERGRLHLPSW